MCIFGDMKNIRTSNISNQSSEKFELKLKNQEKNACYVGEPDNVFGQDSALKENGTSKSPDKQIFDVMTVSAKKGSEKISNKIAQLTTAIPFVDSGTDGNIEAKMKIDITDKNGFVDSGNQDLNVKLNGNVKIKKDVFFNSLKKLEGKAVKRSVKADVDIGKVSFDPKNNSYKIQLKIDGFLFLNDDINLVVKPDKNKNLVMGVEDKWLPDFLESDNDILDEVKSSIAKELKKENFGLNAVIKDGNLMFLPKIENKEIKVNSKESLRIDKTNLDFDHAKFNIDNEGNIDINFKNLEITGSNISRDDKGNIIPEKTANDPDSVNLDIKANINTKGSKEIIINDGSAKVNLDAKEAEIIKVQNSNIGRHFNNTGLELDNLKGKITVDSKNKVDSQLQSDFGVTLERPNKKIKMDGEISAKFNSSGDFEIASKKIEVTQPNGKNKINELYVANDKQEGLKFHLKEDETPLPEIKTKMSKNYLNPLFDGKNYTDKLFASVDKAKESINVESYLYRGKVAEDLTEKLILKAAGLTQQGNYSLKMDNASGVKVKVIFDSSTGDETEVTHESFNMVKNKTKQFINDVEKGNGKFAAFSKEEKQKIIANVNENMKWKMLEGGVTKIDHRKEVIIDGKFAFSGGGINLTDSALRKHDMMMEVWGPAVSDIQKEFIENWEEVAGKVSETEKASLIKPEKDLEKAMKIRQKEAGNAKAVNTQVLITDDNRLDTYQKLIDKIRTSKKINIEHAYFTDKKVIDELSQAIRRGAEVNVIVPEYSDEGDLLHYGNLGSLLTLKQVSEETGSKGKFTGYLYKWNEKENTGRFSHTKAISFDGESAIVGSTNLTSRSLTGTLSGFLFNKEMSLLIEDKEMIGGKNKGKVKRKEEDKGLDETLFAKDMSPEFSKKLDDDFYKSLEKEKDKINKYTQMQPLF